jgi:hypothetical protein
MRKKTMSWRVPGIVFVSAFAMSAACGSEVSGPEEFHCPPQDPKPQGAEAAAATKAATSVPAHRRALEGLGAADRGGPATGTPREPPPGEGSGDKLDDQTPPAQISAAEVRARLHGCSKPRYSAVGGFLKARGMSLLVAGKSASCEIGDGNFDKDTDCNSLPKCQNDTGTNVSNIQVGTTVVNLRYATKGGFCANEKLASDGLSPGLFQKGDGSEICYCPDLPCSDDPSNPGQGNDVELDNGKDVSGNRGVCVKTPFNAGFLYQTARDTMSVPKFDSRRQEKDGHTTSSAMRLFDIFMQAAPEIIQNISSPMLAPACTTSTGNPTMFAADGSCVEEAVSCLIGTPATADHMLLCDMIVQKATDPADLKNKQIIAVAALLSAANTCE